jgi:purine nucleosidase
MPTTRRGFLTAAAGAASTLFTPAGLNLAAAESPRPSPPTPGITRIILDTDTATDDAVAILLALHAPHIKVEAITIAVGNVDYDQETRNALYTLQVSGHANQVPVYQGSRRPLTRAIHGSATYIHGDDGMSNSHFPPPTQKPEKEYAIDAMIRLIEQYPGEITIVAIGAITNIALLLLRKPSIAPLIKSIYFMGGCYKFYGNVTPVASYNIWVDPEAARIVFQSGIPITTAGFELSVKSSIFTDEDYARVEQMNTPLAKFFLSINKIRRVYCKEHQKMNGSNHPDALTTALVIDPTIATELLPRFCDIETQGELTRGVMVIDELGVYNKPPNVTICAAADQKKFKDMVFATLAG